jgi:hypothetical protein
MRIMVTGSRDWPNLGDVAMALAAASVEHDDDEITLISGACPTGADRQAEEVAARHKWTIERYPADWAQYGKRAGYLRNAAMDEAGADVCLAFIKDNSRGASMTLQLAQAAGIECRVYRRKSAGVR